VGATGLLSGSGKVSRNILAFEIVNGRLKPNSCLRRLKGE